MKKLLTLSTCITFLFLSKGTTAYAQLVELQPILEVAGTDSGAALGFNVSGIADINKDGYADVAVSVYGRGVTQVFLGGNPMSNTPAYTLWGNSKVVSGDFNGDGWIDLVIAKTFNDSVFVYFGGSAFDIIPDVILRIESGRANEFLNLVVGDIDGDGYHDIVIGSENYLPDDPLKNRVGKLYVFAGGLTLETTPKFTVEGETAVVQKLGLNVAVGDINNDSRQDLIALGKTSQGNKVELKMCVYLGKPNLQLVRDRFFSVAHDTNNTSEFGIEIFDADDDGIEDVILDGIFIYRGQQTLDSLPTYRVQVPTDYKSFFGDFPRIWNNGADFNGDGVKDILFTTSYGFPGVGGFHIMYSRKNLPGTDYKAFRTYSYDRYYYLSGWPADAGDVNGDGVADVLIGAPSEPITTQKGFFGIYAGDSNIVTSVSALATQLSDFSLQQNFPNPFNPETTIEYTLLTAEQVQIAVCDLLGNRVRLLKDEFQSAGKHSIRWDGNSDSNQKLPSGTYFYTIQTPTLRQTKKALILR